MTVMPALPQADVVPVAAPTGLPAAAAMPADPTSGFGALVAQLMGLAPTAPGTAVGAPVALPTAPGPGDAPAPVAGSITGQQAPDAPIEQAKEESVDSTHPEAVVGDGPQPALPTMAPALAAQLAIAALATRIGAPVGPAAPAADAVGVTDVVPSAGAPSAGAQIGTPTPIFGATATVPATTPTPAFAPPTATTEASAPVAATVLVETAPVSGIDPQVEPSAAAAADTLPTPTPTAGSSPAGSSGTAVSSGAVIPTATITPATATGVPVPTTAPEVHRQVFPEVTRLVSAGNGTHRITLELQPEALGEVKVTLIVRDGSVHVRLSAGDDAQRALLEGAPELRRLLELGGASDTKIVVRDLLAGSASGGTAPPTPQAQADGGSDRHAGGSAGAGGREAPNQHAGTRGGGSTAREGISGGASTPRHVDQVTHTRTTGVDVTV